MATRSVRMRINNTTGFALRKTGGSLCHGVFTEPFSFPETIPPGESGVWQAESGGDIPILGSIATGTEGWVKYRLVSSIPNVENPVDVVLFYWDNPFVGNTFFGFEISTRNIKPSRRFNMAESCDDGSIMDESSNFRVQPSGFKFFPLHFVAGQLELANQTQGDLNDGIALILPIQANGPSAHAWFEIGIRDTNPPRSQPLPPSPPARPDAISVLPPLMGMNVDPSIGIRRSLGVTIPFSLRQLLSEPKPAPR